VERSVKMRVTTGWVEYGSAIAWTEERESVMITMEGDRGSGPERDGFKTMEDGQELDCEN